MESKIIEHLENIKIFTEYKKSGLANLNEFWERIDSGKSVENLQDNLLSFRPIDGFDPTKEELEKSFQQRERLERIDKTELYLRSIKDKIITCLEKDKADLPILFRLEQLEGLIKENRNLEQCLATSEVILGKYIVIAKGTSPDDFFNNVELQENHIQLNSTSKNLFLDKYQQIPENEHSDIFANKGFRFYSILADNFPKTDSDKAYIFWKLKSDKYIHGPVGESDFVRFLFSIGTSVGRLKQFVNIGTTTRDPFYNFLHQLLRQ